MAKAAQGAASARRGSAMWVQGLACGACLAFATPTALLLAILFAPALICLLVDAGRDRGILRAVSVTCGAASLAPVWHLWLNGDHIDQALASLSDPFVLVLAWGGGAIAWALCQLLPVILSGSWDMQSSARMRAIEAELKTLNEEWDLAPTP